MSTQPEPPTPGSLFPVCCAAVIPPETIDSFITKAQEQSDADESLFVFVDDTTRVYETETEVGEWTEPTSAESPFIGISPLQSYLLLRQLITDNDSDINHHHFVIMDDRTIQDGTVLLVEGPWGAGEDEGEARTIRVEPKIAQERLLLYNIGEPEIDEDQAIAQEAEDGVLRLEAIENHPPP